MAENMASPPAESGLAESDENIMSASTASELSRIFNSAGIIPGPGGYLSFNPRDDDDDEEDEDVAEDFVAVDHNDAHDYSYLFRRPSRGKQRTPLDELYPFTSVLTVGNVEDCVTVEEAFPEHERASREKFVYRLTKCPELSLGIFSLPILDRDQPKPRPELIAHIIATRTSAPRVTEESMAIPENWQTRKRSLPDAEEKNYVGHEDQGGTVALHSLAVKEEHQHKRVGSTLMKSYIQRIKEAAIADRIALLAHDHMVPFYEALGFVNLGPSACTFGGGGWFDMVLEFPKDQASE
ncbi:GNAT family acetyltransferase, putative [Talaromyces stipitatus ATCC 10500]|uniref:GNAT family acetyltransferase, putative n=1 Tax=Talaromyces stipitatus (strain ATCC 10500 / CBS 375.48 / QM 6759 / NRRL 1006) TaxID=441959 RepID=B8M3U8_TALSN|nr:GNAT family acetyltransferase, putative [Talaromyces stipitatus ATCC 10500]XP_002481126.1 GNAT family acetyltransferase, putative [Talaromyces stipitatus ATCC 10500]EED20691.1 GNAT family acetyltransferase, putative [Talaromyces stipitatus ATCC 10500]EED20692.1 GNAT family acetyltransferase, putative [Talaromyces stipitatus ATCC 10500]